MSIAPIAALVRDPAFIASLTDAERLVLPYAHHLWLRPEQRIPAHQWRYCGTICGRGWGKSYAISCEINRRVMAGEARHVALMAPTDDRVWEVQSSFLIATSPPWFKAEAHDIGVKWPNGVITECFTPLAPGRSRSGNFDLTWLCELVDWAPNTRKEAFDNITTATRVGRAQVLWDTTSKGRNDVISHLLELHAADPVTYPITRGSMFDNPLLSAAYLKAECMKYTGRRFEEEIEGKDFQDSQGALWRQEWIARNRVDVRPASPRVRIIGVDPALSARSDADETGIVDGEADAMGHVFVIDDLSGRYTPEQWGDIVVARCIDGAAGCVIERNRGGDPLVALLRARARERKMQVREVEPGKPFPLRTDGVMYVKQVVARDGKTDRGGTPAALTESGHVHHVGRFDKLESELCTYEPGMTRSPNRYDAFVYMVLELSGIERAPAQSPSEAASDVAAALQALRAKMQASARHGRRVD